MLGSVRCHAVVSPSGVCKNAVIAYDGDSSPVFDKYHVVTPVSGVEIMSFIGEIHSTVDYNGIAVITDASADLSDVELTVDTIVAVVSHLASKVSGGSWQAVHFIPLI